MLLQAGQADWISWMNGLLLSSIKERCEEAFPKTKTKTDKHKKQMQRKDKMRVRQREMQ
jgi:hypothetical protein